MMPVLKSRNQAPDTPTREVTLRKMARLSTAMGVVLRVVATVYLVVTAFNLVTTTQIALNIAGRGAETAMNKTPAGGFGGITVAAADGSSSITLLSDEGRNTIGVLLGSILGAAALLVAAHFFSAVGTTRQPFTAERARDLKRIGILLVIQGLTSRLVGMFATLAVFSALGYHGSWSFSEVIDIAPLALGACILMFAHVFAYGCILQEQDDGLL